MCYTGVLLYTPGILVYAARRKYIPNTPFAAPGGRKNKNQYYFKETFNNFPLEDQKLELAVIYLHSGPILMEIGAYLIKIF